MQAFKRHAELGYLAGVTGLSHVSLPGNILVHEWDSWHTLILTDEMSRVVRVASGFVPEERADIFRVTVEFYGDLGVETVSVFPQL